MTDEPKIIPIEYLKIEPNLEKLPTIFKKLNLKNKKIQYEITKNIEIHKNKYIIIELLEELSEMIGETRTSMNEYKFYCINRDLKQVGSPIFHENNPSFETISTFPHDYVTLTVGEIIDEYLEIQDKKGYIYVTMDKKGYIPVVIENPITKGQLMQIMKYLLNHDVFYTYDLSEIFDDPLKIDDELYDILEYDHEIRCLKIFWFYKFLNCNGLLQ